MANTKSAALAPAPGGEPEPGAAPVAQPEEGTAAGEAPTREQIIAVTAYFLAEKRGFAPGCELEDWLQAEAEVYGRQPRMPRQD